MGIEDDELIEAYKKSELISVINSRLLEKFFDRKSISDQLVELHNSNKINIIEVFLELKNDSKGTNFFLMSNIFEEALPKIEASVEEVMECVLHLMKEAGNDMMANFPFSSFIKFISAKPNRISEARDFLLSEPHKWSDFLVSIIVVGSKKHLKEYVSLALDLIDHEVPEIARNAIFSLGKIEYGEENILNDVIKKIFNEVKQKDDDIFLASAIKTALNLVRQNPDMTNEAHSIISYTLEKGGMATLYAASEAFGQFADDLPDRILSLFINYLPKICHAREHSLWSIDRGLSSLFKKDSEIAISTLESLLISGSDSCKIKALNTTTHTILKDKAILNHLIVRWFLSGNPVLCSAIYEIISTAHKNQLELEILPNSLPQQDPNILIFLARKAIGFLFTRPVTATSIILSLIRLSDSKETKNELRKYIFEFLLMNYTGSVKEYLEKKSSETSDEVSKIIRQLLEHYEIYIEQLKSIEDIPELHPSTMQQQEYMRKINREFTEAHKEAMKGSLVEQLFKKSVILYGNASIFHVKGKVSDTPNRMEVPMHQISVSTEFPRQLYFDPIGLDYRLRVFRAERIIKHEADY